MQLGDYTRVSEGKLKKTPVKAGDKVRFISVFDLAPDQVHDMLGEIGTAKKEEVIQTEVRSWSVWLVIFEDRQIWIKERGLEVVG